MRIEHIDKAIAGTGNVIVLCSILFGKGHEDEPVDFLDIERRITLGRMRIRELGKVQIGVIDIHRAFAEVLRMSSSGKAVLVMSVMPL